VVDFKVDERGITPKNAFLSPFVDAGDRRDAGTKAVELAAR
jgi:hypothetical protein